MDKLTKYKIIMLLISIIFIIVGISLLLILNKQLKYLTPLVLLLIGFIGIIALYLWYINPYPNVNPGTTTKIPDYESEQLYKLNVQVRALHMILPFVVILLTYFGFNTYDRLYNELDKNLTTKLDPDKKIQGMENRVIIADSLLKKAKKEIDSLTHTNTKELDSIKSEYSELVGNIYLPVGTIVAYQGKSENIPFGFWAICDGKNGTPNLIDKFILGGNYNSKNLGKPGGTKNHSHELTITFNGSSVSIPVTHSVALGGGKTSFKLHNKHSINIKTDKKMISNTDHLPPYIQLVYLMKIK